MSIGDDGGGAAEALAQMNISKTNLVDATGLLKYDMFPHGWLTDSTADFSKVPVIKYEIQAAVLREQSANVRYQLPAFEKLRAVRAPTLAGRAENTLHRQWLDSDPSDVQPVFEDDVNGKAGYNCDAVIQLHRWRHGNRPLRTPSKRHAVSNCPHQEAAK